MMSDAFSPVSSRSGAADTQMKTVVILISGRGSNLLALLEAKLPGRISAVISDRGEAQGLAFAQARGVATAVIDHRRYTSREAFDAALTEEVEAHRADLVVLAGFMRILGDDFVRRFAGRLLNIHPSLLPMFPGLKPHAQALAAGVKIHGCTVHVVTPSLDAGPIVVQAAVPVHGDDDQKSLAARVLVQEHRIYPQAVRWFLEDRLRLSPDGRVVLQGEGPPAQPLIAPASA